MHWLAKRLLLLPVITFAVVSLSFLLIHFIPGDPIDALLGELAQAQQVEALRAQLGLDRPLTEQYVRYLIGTLTGDWGISLIDQSPIAPEVARRLLQSAKLAFFGVGLATLLGLSLGILSSLQYGKATDRVLRVLSLLVYATPAFCLGPLLVWIFAIKLQMLPVNDCCSLPHLILPGLTLGFGLFALIFQHTRAALLETLPEDFMKTAKAKGLSRRYALLTHALPNAAFPILTIVGSLMSALLGGAVVVETLFDWPGLGSYLILSLQRRDYPAVQACVLVLALIMVIVNLVTDVLQQWVNPKVEIGKAVP